MKINYMLDKGAFAPVRAHVEDAGWDLKSPLETYLHPLDHIVIDTGIHVEIPKGYVGFLKSKSGLNVKLGITSEGVIDSGYTGSIVVKLYRDDRNDLTPYKINVGDKITQLVILPIPETEMNEVSSFSETERGNNGFGSSGR